MSIFKKYQEQDQDILFIPKVSSFRGEVELIGSKSIANRALILSSFCEEETLLQNVPDSEDVSVLIENLPFLGIEIQKLSSKELLIKGSPEWNPKKNYFNLKNAGTALRPLIAILSTKEIHQDIVIDGNEQMRKRPIKDLVEALSQIGVEIQSQNGYPPVKIQKGGWRKNQIFLSGKTSSQYLSALLLAAPLTFQEIEIFITDELVSKPYVDITIALMKKFQVEVINENYRYFNIPKQFYRSPKTLWIEGDATAATYFWTAGLLSGPVSTKGITLNSIQGDIQYLEVIKTLGGKVEFDHQSVRVFRLYPIKGLSIDMNAMPDAAMTLAITGLFAETYIEIYNVENLRVKESERIRGLHNELKKFGATVEERKDGLKIYPPKQIPKTPRIETYHDHRMAMAFSLASFLSDLEIINPDCVKKTYPNYFQDFESLCVL
ncbi:MAG: 3-phosphoshikimate 1-carboxyvinyltransferase [Leptospiraceae bacterium]|nr:3-phosphoshikimate 1-carboxyvinyltransferase [Leptospiraceae bacterium]MDW7976449.1 3-phosphoshikimate 1-carboxyvinyltransferase [Leptospiraceae bacterium]